MISQQAARMSVSDIRDNSDTTPDFALLIRATARYVRGSAHAAFAAFSGGAVSIARM